MARGDSPVCNSRMGPLLEQPVLLFNLVQAEDMEACHPSSSPKYILGNVFVPLVRKYNKIFRKEVSQMASEKFPITNILIFGNINLC